MPMMLIPKFMGSSTEHEIALPAHSGSVPVAGDPHAPFLASGSTDQSLEASSGPQRFRWILRIVGGVAGWVWFFYWWYLVTQETPLRVVEHVGVQMSALVVAVPLCAAGWIMHNLKLARRGKRGLASRYVPPRFTHDVAGRTLELSELSTSRTEAHVFVRIKGDAKQYTDARSEKLKECS